MVRALETAEVKAREVDEKGAGGVIELSLS